MASEETLEDLRDSLVDAIRSSVKYQSWSVVYGILHTRIWNSMDIGSVYNPVKRSVETNVYNATKESIESHITKQLKEYDF